MHLYIIAGVIIVSIISVAIGLRLFGYGYRKEKAPNIVSNQTDQIASVYRWGSMLTIIPLMYGLSLIIISTQKIVLIGLFFLGNLCLYLTRRLMRSFYDMDADDNSLGNILLQDFGMMNIFVVVLTATVFLFEGASVGTCGVFCIPICIFFLYLLIYRKWVMIGV